MDSGLDQDDPDDDGGYVYGEGEAEEWHKERCPCELCRVERLELIERVIASRPLCEGEDCQGCGNCPEVKQGRPASEIIKEEDEWLITRLNTTNPEVTPDYWRTRVEEGTFNLPELPFRPPYPGFGQYVLKVEQKGEALPALLTRSDGATIFYAQKINTVFGEPGMAKSWIALETAIAALEKGGRVLWWDFEDKPDTLYRRAKAIDKLDLITGGNVAFIKDNNILELDEDGLPNPALLSAVEWLVEGGIYSVFIIDAAESSGAPSDGSPVAEWNREKIQPFANRNVGGLILDHVPKQRKERPRGAIGSTHKLAKIDGAALGISGKAWTKTQDGALILRLEKDRHGDVPGNIGAKVAVVKGHYEGELLTISIDPPNQDDDGEEDVYMMLLDVIGAAGAEGVRGVKTLYSMVKGKSQAKAEALSELIGNGLVVQSKDGKAKVHTITEEGAIVLGEGGE